MPDNRKVILVADDDPGMRMILGHILAAEGYAVINTDNGRSALEMAQSEHPDLMILDMNMPFLDGLEVLRRLRNLEPPLEYPAILLTAGDPNILKDPAESLGAVRFLEKPFDLEVLLQEIKNNLKS